MMTSAEAEDAHFEALIRFVQEHRGMDFRGYKRASLRRRITKRMEAVEVPDVTAYHALLEANPREFAALLDTVLINVTSFFRDPEAWDVMRREVIPRIVERHRTDGNGIRIWSAGCATGQEPYSLAMLFAEAMGGAEAFCQGAKIYATDLDEGALQVARHATYTRSEVEGVSPELLERYFEADNDHYTLQRELRRCVIFGRHNIIHDAPIGRADLLLCRNLLIYVEAATQEAVLPRLHYALRDDGYLCLGRAETQLARSRLFEPVDLKHRVFRKVAENRHRTSGGSLAFSRGPAAEQSLSPGARVLEAIVDGAATAYLVVGLDGRLTFANPASRRLLEIEEADLGRPFQDLPVSYRPTELRGRIEEVQRLGRPVRLDHQEFARSSADPLRLTVEVTPLLRPDGQPFSTLISFADTTRTFQLGQELLAVQEGLETHIEELQSSNEELETTNEELQSTREELETTNEELQSTNEELETMNEELRSTNDELQLANEELRRRSEEALEYRHHCEAVLRSLDAGMVVLDRDLKVTGWNRWCENAWGLRDDEALGEEFLALDIGLPVERLRADIYRILATEASQAAPELEAMDRRGRQVSVKVRMRPLLRDGRAPEGLVLLIEHSTEPARAREV